MHGAGVKHQAADERLRLQANEEDITELNEVILVHSMVPGDRANKTEGNDNIQT